MTTGICEYEGVGSVAGGVSVEGVRRGGKGGEQQEEEEEVVGPYDMRRLRCHRRRSFTSRFKAAGKVAVGRKAYCIISSLPYHALIYKVSNLFGKGDTKSHL